MAIPRSDLPRTDLGPLVLAARGGDRGAFEQLVRVTASDTYSLAHRLVGNEDDARDVVQEAYLRAFRGIQRFRGDAQFSTWLHRITANCAASHLGRRLRHRHDDLGDDDVVADGSPAHDPVAVAESHALRDRLTAELADLPPRLRAVVVLRDVYDLPHEAIASELGISVAAAKVRLHRARKRLRERLFPLPGEEGAVAGAVWDALARTLSAATDGEALDARASRHVGSCIRCQAELAQYRKLIRVLRTLRTEVLSPGPSLAADILAGLEQAGERSAVRSLLSGRRPIGLGGVAVATAAAAGAGAVLVRRQRGRGAHRSRGRPGGPPPPGYR